MKQQNNNNIDIMLLILVIALMSTCILQIFTLENIPHRGKLILMQELSSLVKPDNNLREITEEIISYCATAISIRDCKRERIYDFVMLNVTQENDILFDFIEIPFLINNSNNPIETLENGGDCENLAVLMATMFKMSGEFDVYLLEQQCEDAGHACVMLLDANEAKLYNCFSDCEIVAVKKV